MTGRDWACRACSCVLGWLISSWATGPALGALTGAATSPAARQPRAPLASRHQPAERRPPPGARSQARRLRAQLPLGCIPLAAPPRQPSCSIRWAVVAPGQTLSSDPRPANSNTYITRAAPGPRTARPPDRPRARMAPLLTLCKEGRADEVAALVERDPALPFGSSWLTRQSPFHVAAKHNCPSVLRALCSRLEAQGTDVSEQAVIARLSRGADPRDCVLNSKDRRGRTPLLLACERGSAEAVKALSSLGADVWVRDKWGRTSLHVAISRGHVACSEEVIAAALASTLHPLQRCAAWRRCPAM